MKIIWSKEYELGIRVIDAQHQRIVEYINEIYVLSERDARADVSEVLQSLVDYTFSHLAFEEAMLEDVDYSDLVEHQIAHRTFGKQVETLQKRFKQGEDVAIELAEFLRNWLLEHILTEDAAYCEIVKTKLLKIEPGVHQNWVKRTTARFFS
jgi:hemerythrin